MKYIRTKDGHIYELSHISSIFDDKNKPVILNAVSKNTNEIICIKGKDILKQADTIEDLCDEFVIVCEDSSLNTIFQKLKEARIAGSYFECNHEYYGAIWTDKGLIYVAKMNEKGELKLL